MISQRPPLHPDPYDPYRLSQQKIGLEECQGYIDQDQRSWAYQPQDADRLRAMWHLGAWLEPAIEGLCRQYPEAARLCDSTDNHTVASGVVAYEQWMRLTPYTKATSYLEFTPPTPHPVTHSLLLGWPLPREISVSTYEQNAGHAKGVFRMHNSYHEEINGDSYQTVRNICMDVLPRTDMDNPVVYSPFTPSTRAERGVLGLLVRERFGDFAADVYDEHDTAGLGAYRIRSTLGVLFDRLVKVT